MSDATARAIRVEIEWLLAARLSIIGRRSTAKHEPTIRIIQRPHTPVEPVGTKLALRLTSDPRAEIVLRVPVDREDEKSGTLWCLRDRRR